MKLADRIIRTLSSGKEGIRYTVASKSAIHQLLIDKYDCALVEIISISELEDEVIITFENDVIHLKFIYEKRQFKYIIKNVEAL